MFTGLVLGMGQVEAVDNRGAETRLTIRALFDLPDIEKGESIAVNGACLTVETFGENRFSVYASAETMRVTSLGQLRGGSKCNLERALAVGDRLGGHIVSGHVDCTGEVVSVAPAGESRIYRLRLPREHARFVIEKGSVALDGISLTVNACGADWLEVNIIPETQQVTTIGQWAPGRTVNIETDVIGKYVQRLVGPYADGGKGGSGSRVTMDFLREHGF